jgi:hypothetical protein
VPAEGVDGESVGDDRVEARSDERQDGFQELPDRLPAHSAQAAVGVSTNGLKLG